MLLELKNFKIWEDKTFDFGEKGLVLLNGLSGKGKSSAFQAIMFALFGKGNKITTYGKSSTKVTLTIDDLVIERSIKPKRLVVNQTIVDDQAQEIINKKYSNVFDVIGYIEQKTTNNFITMTPMNRLAFIEKFAFESINLGDVKQKIKCIRNERLEIQNTLKGKKTELERFIEDLEKEELYIEECGDETIEDCEDKISHYKKLLKKERKKLEDFSIERSCIVNTNKKYEEYTQELSSLKTLREKLEKKYIGDEQLEELEKIAKNYQHIQKVKEYNELLQERDGIEKKIITDEEYDRLNNEMEFQYYFNLLADQNFNMEEYERKKREASATYFNCPKCDVLIGIIDDEPEICSNKEDKEELKKELVILKQEYKKYKQWTQEIKKYHSCSKTFDGNIKDYLDEQDDLKDQKNILDKKIKRFNLKDIDIPEIDIDYSELNEKIQENTKTKLKLETNEKYITKYSNQLGEIDYVDTEEIEQNIQKSKNTIISCENKIEKFEAKLNIIKKNEVVKEKINRINNYKAKLEIAEKEYKEITEKLVAIDTLKDKVLEAQNIAIKNVIETIELNVQKYLDKFFEDPISLSISRFTEKNKPQLNIELTYKNYEIRVDSLSGGEQDRLILAFTLALSDLFGLNVILLDEIIGSLDVESTSSILDIVKENTKGKLVIFIAHQLVSGQFDKVINL